MSVVNVNGEAAIRIVGKMIKQTQAACLINCDGDLVWFPTNTVRVNADGTVDIQEWIFKEKFPNG